MLERFQMHQVVVLTEHIGMSFVVGDTGMITTVAFRRTHDVVLPLPRTRRTVAHGVAQGLRTAGRGITEVIMTVALIDPRTFLIVLHGPVGSLRFGHPKIDLGTLFLDGTHHTILRIEHTDVTTGRNHILIELDVIDMRIAPVHIGLTIVINEHRRIDVIPMLFLPYERFAKGIFERTVR